MSKHYHVIENTPGYLPDDTEPPFAFTSRRVAEQSANEQANRYREEGEERPGRWTKSGRWVRPKWMPEYQVSGNARDGYRIARVDSEHDLGRVIYVDECSEAECLEDLEQ